VSDDAKYTIIIIIAEDNGICEELLVGSVHSLDNVRYDLTEAEALDVFEDLTYEGRKFS
jgi:hypothetical protein